jgi:hypothetical protein
MLLGSTSLTLFDKLALSAALAYGVLWLYQSPWLNSTFSTFDFTVIANNKPNEPSFKRLFLTKYMLERIATPERFSDLREINSAGNLLSVHPVLRTRSIPNIPGPKNKENRLSSENNCQNGHLSIPQLTRGGSAQAVHGASSAYSSNNPPPYIQNETMFALGITLIEICFGRSIEQLRATEDFGGDDPELENYAQNYATATKLLKAGKSWQNQG